MADPIRIAQDQFPPQRPAAGAKPSAGGSQAGSGQAKNSVDAKAKRDADAKAAELKARSKAVEDARLAAEKEAEAAREAEAKQAPIEAKRKEEEEQKAEADAEATANFFADLPQTGDGTNNASAATTKPRVTEVQSQSPTETDTRKAGHSAETAPPPSLDDKKPEPASLGEVIGVTLKEYGIDPVMHIALPSTLLALTMLTALLVSTGRSRSLKRERAATIARASQQLQHPFRSLPEIADRAKQIADGGYHAAVQMHAQLEAAKRREADVFASGDLDRQLRSLGLPVILNIEARVQAQLGDLVHDADYAAVDEVLHLSDALDSLREGLQEVSAGTRGSERGVDPMTDVFYSGFEDGWFEELIKAELVLRAYSSPGTGWSELAEKLGVICGLGRALLGLHGMEILTHPVPAPRTMAVRVYETDERGLCRIGFVREVIQRLVGPRPADQGLVVDCVRLGTADRRSRKLRQPTVALYNHMDWR